MNESNANFLKEIVSPSNAIIDIVAVHGMNMTNDLNHADNTWTQKETGTNWLKDLLPKRLPNARILAYQYNANVVFGTSDAGVEEQAMNMLVFLSSKRTSCSIRPIIFIAHSLGGLIVKAALATANYGDGSYVMVATMTYGIIFFGVPHQGSAIVPWGRIVAQIASSYGGRINKSYMKGVESGSPYNEILNGRFKPLLENYKFLSVCEMLEERRSGWNFGVIVEKESALLGLADSQEVKIYPNRSHSTICKFEGDHDPVWKQVSDFLYHGASSAFSYSGYSPMVVKSTTVLDSYAWHSQDTLLKDISVSQATEHAQKILADLEEDSAQIDRFQIQVQDHNSVMEGQAMWLLSFLVQLVWIPFVVAAALILPSEDVVRQKAITVEDSLQEAIVLEQKVIDTLNAQRIQALDAVRTLQLASCTMSSEHHDDSETNQLGLVPLQQKMDERTEQVMRDLLRHSKAHFKAERILNLIQSGLCETKSKKGEEFWSFLNEKKEEEEMKEKKHLPKDPRICNCIIL